MGHRPLVAEALEKGDLVAPFDRPGANGTALVLELGGTAEASLVALLGR